MGITFSSNALSGFASEGLPSTSYAYAAGNTASLGADVTYIYDGPPGFGPVGEVTPFLVNPESASVTCSPITASATSQSLKCPVAGTALTEGLYTLSFLQYFSTAYSTDDAGTTYYAADPDFPTLTSYDDGYTYSFIPAITTIETTDTVTSTVTPYLTAYATVTSGVSEIAPTATVDVPASVVTVTVYDTTLVSSQTTQSTITGLSTVITKTATCPKSTTTLLKCSQDNCYRAMSNRLTSASSFCAGYTTATGLPTPSYLTQCSGLTSRVSSACTCLFSPTKSVTARGLVVATYAAPDFTYSDSVAAVTIVQTAPAPTTVVDGPYPSATVTDADVTVSSGTSTATDDLPSTVTVTRAEDCCNSPTSFIIPSSKPSSRRPANIPLRTLSNPAARSSSQPTSALLSSSRENDKQGGRSSLSRSTSPDSEFSWSDTGDLAEQLADAEDPLQIKLRDSLEEEVFGGSSRRPIRHKKVRYHDQDGDVEDKAYRSGIIKEDIEIPRPPPKNITRLEHFLAFIMSGGERQMHGLTGKALIYFTSIFVSLGVFLFGYDQGVMSGIITGPFFESYFNKPSRAEVGTMVAILEVGAFFASLVVGRVGDIIGRRKTILYGSIIFFTGGALQSFANGMTMMLFGRIIAGVGVGMLSTIVPVYQSEISPPHNRGKLACIEFSGNITGYATSVWVDYFCSYIDSDYSWRIPLLMQCVMGALLGIGSLIIVESPRWLLDNDHDEEGIVVIANLYGGGDIHNPKARDEYREIKMDVLLSRQEGEKSYSDMFRRYRTRVFIAMSAQAFAQLNGINVISYYAPLVFESAGWAGRKAILMTGINAITYFLCTIPPWYLVDRLGRRFILLSGAIAMALSLSAISYFLYLKIELTPTLVVIFVMIYNGAFGYSWGPIPWLYPPEILPLSIRSKGASLSTATNWAFNWLVGELTPVLQEWIEWRLYLVHAFFCATSFVVVYFIYPETAGIRLEDMDAIFGDATTAMPTPATHGVSTPLMGNGISSPVPSMDLRRGVLGGSIAGLGSSNAIPGLDIDPPHVNIENGRPQYSRHNSERGSISEGVGGWISRIVKRGSEAGLGGRSRGDSLKSGQYKPLDQEEGRGE